MAKTALITGCSSGIGRGTAEAFLEADWTVFATARDPDELDSLDRRGCRTAELNVTDSGAVERVVDRVFDEAGRLDCLVNNAGYGQFGPVEDVPLERVREQFDVNTFGPLRLIQAALPRMRRRGSGTIVNVGGGFRGITGPGIGVYTGSKYALHSMTDALRQEVSGADVDVVLVLPGVVATEFYDRVLEEISSYDRTPEYVDLYEVLDDVPVVERGGPGVNRPERVAETILEAATADAPRPAYYVGRLSSVGSLTGTFVRGRFRDRISRASVRGLASDPVQGLLENRRR
jgi:NAD(P)-dependent dehydrogenase (short-subunit alcohol dehydrogenase family)